MSQPDMRAYERWTPAAQERALEALRAQVSGRTWRPFYCNDFACTGDPHGKWEWNHARQDQRPPRDTDWLVWLLKSGRGSGKTRTGSEYTNRATKKYPRIALIGATGADVRDTMIEGESGILTVARPGERPKYEPSKRRVTWPNGAVATIFTAEEPDRLRGPEHYFAWCDEAAFYPNVEAVWDNLMFGLRLGPHPRVMVTTTPKARPWLRELVNDPRTRMSVASTYDNLKNLSPVFAERIIARYEGTRLGRQELLAEILEDVEGALWTWELIERARVTEPPDHLDRIVVAIDPAGSRTKRSDETGIVVVGSVGEEVYVLKDLSGHYSPHGWATAANAAYDEYSADAIVAEKNNGGDMVRHTLRTSGYSGARVLTVQARRGKALRAEPVVGRYEKGEGHVHHVGAFPELETQQTEWVPYEGGDSPDRVDALVYGVTHVLAASAPATIASPARYGKRLSRDRLTVITGGAA